MSAFNIANPQVFRYAIEIGTWSPQLAFKGLESKNPSVPINIVRDYLFVGNSPQLYSQFRLNNVYN